MGGSSRSAHLSQHHHPRYFQPLGCPPSPIWYSVSFSRRTRRPVWSEQEAPRPSRRTCLQVLFSLRNDSYTSEHIPRVCWRTMIAAVEEWMWQRLRRWKRRRDWTRTGLSAALTRTVTVMSMSYSTRLAWIRLCRQPAEWKVAQVSTRVFSEL